VSKFSNENAARLTELLQQESDLLKSLRDKGMEQVSLLETGEIEAFAESLEKGQAIIGKIDGLHQEINVLMQSYVSFLDSGNKKIDAIEVLRIEVRTIVAECAKLNEKNMAKAGEKVNNITGEITDKSQKRKSVGVYGQGVVTSSEYFDKKT